MQRALSGLAHRVPVSGPGSPGKKTDVRYVSQMWGMRAQVWGRRPVTGGQTRKDNLLVPAIIRVTPRSLKLALTKNGAFPLSLEECNSGSELS